MPWLPSFSKGELLYYHSETNEVTDICPSELIDEDRKYFWITHHEEIFFPGKLVENYENETVVVENINGQLLKISSNSIGESIPSIRSLLRLPNDLIEMDSISQPAVYYTLRARFLQDLIYTSLGDILLIVNPFKLLPNPSIDSIHPEEKGTLPHPYLTSARAYHEMIKTKRNQTILIGGESGSGKTETTKTCLSYLSHLSSKLTGPNSSSSGQAHIEERIMASNPLLEAFGNAKTIRNDNSSRFGKYLEIIYSTTTGQIAQCRTTSYLLEKCRIHRQNSGERNYHIFYQICRAIELAIISIDEGKDFSSRFRMGSESGKGSILDDPQYLSQLQIQSLNDYQILTSSGCTDIEGVNDCQGFLETECAAYTLGFSVASVQLLVSTCAAILHLGNIQFIDVINSDGAESCIIGGVDDLSALRSSSSLHHASQLLGVDSQSLSEALRVKKLAIRGEQTEVLLTSNQAKEARDSICKALYSNLFDWIVKNVTVSFSDQPLDSQNSRFIGILDIFGFEIFDVNYFEQLCINYANEKLQQFFNMTVFKSEQSLYELEGIPFQGFVFSDNQDVLNLIEDKSYGILSIIDDEINIPRANDNTLLRKLMNAFMLQIPSNTEQSIAAARFSTVTSPSSSQDVFLISHYAGRVEYRIDGFLDTSRDKVSDDLMTLIDSCCGGFFSKSTVPPPPSSTSKATTPAPPRSNTVKSQTLGKKFKIQLESLLTVLTTTSPHYIKCIKPNTMKVPNCFQGTTCFAQLQALGIFEAVAIRKRGFPYRVPHEEFNRVYSPLFKQQLIAKNALKASGKIKAEILVSELNKLNGPDAVHHFLIGKSKVFAKFEARDAAKKLLENYQIGCAIKIQRMTRGFVARMAFCDFCYAALDANTLLSVPDPDNEKYLDEVEVLLKKLQRFPYQHYQRLLEMKSRIHDRLSLLKEIEDMQSVPFSAINSKWMSKAQYARKKGIMTSAAERVYEMYDTIMRGEGEDTPDLDEEPLDLNTKESVLKSEGHVQEVTTQDFKEIELPPVSRLICSLCRKQYEPPPLKRSPRYLSCLHVFCSVCLADRMERTSGGIMCPNSDCRVLSRCPDGLTSFKIAYALVHQLPPICRNCESKNSVCICLDCPVDSSLLCMACLKSHNKIKAYKHHSVHGLDSDTPVHPHDMSRCIHHPEKDLDAYCRTCQQLVCLSCAVFHHANHTIQPYQQAAEIERSRLLPCFSELLSDISSLQSKQRDLHETEPQLELQNKTMKELLNRIFQSLHHTLANRRTDFLSVLDVYYTQKRKALVDYSEALNYHITCQESSSKICSEMLDLGNDTEVLSVSRFLHTHLDDMLQNSWQQDLSNLETTLSFSCGPEHDAKNLISSIGICKGSLICADPTKSTLEVLQIGEFCQQWQVLIRLTLRNIKGQKLTKGGHAVTIDVDEITESPIHSHTPSVSPHTPDNSMITTPSPHAPPPLSTPVPHGLGKLSTRSPTSFTLKSAQQSIPPPTNTVEIQHSTQTNQRTKTSKFNTGLTDNQDGTYHLLVTSIPSPSSGGDNTPSNHSLPQAINVSIKVFGINVHESPLLFHPHDANEMKSYHTNRITSQTTPHIPPAPSSSNGTSTEFTSVSTFLKYISGGLISA